MEKYILMMPESKTQEVLNYLKKFRGVKVKPAVEAVEEFVILDWQKNLVEERLKSAKKHPEQLIPLKEFEKRMKKHVG